jgi:hypothetical protein
MRTRKERTTRSWLVVGTAIAGCVTVGLGLVTDTPALAITGAAVVVLGALAALVLLRRGARGPVPLRSTADRAPDPDAGAPNRLRDVGAHRYIDIPDDIPHEDDAASGR